MLVFDGAARPVPGLPHWRVRAFSEVGSTNAVALDAALAGDPGGLWVVGGLQTSGRGRRAQAWISEPGNLYASCLVIDPGPADRLSVLPLAAALALAEAVDAMCGTHGLARLKWPNDLVVDGAKISGILIEATPLPDGRRAVVLGFGLNLAHHPDLPGYRAADLAGLGYRVSVDQAFRALALAVERRLAVWAEGAVGETVAGWRARATGIGAPIRVRLETRELDGIFEGVDDVGRLRLRQGDGALAVVAAGDVFFGEAG